MWTMWFLAHFFSILFSGIYDCMTDFPVEFQARLSLASNYTRQSTRNVWNLEARCGGGGKNEKKRWTTPAGWLTILFGGGSGEKNWLEINATKINSVTNITNRSRTNRVYCSLKLWKNGYRQCAHAHKYSGCKFQRIPTDTKLVV